MKKIYNIIKIRSKGFTLIELIAVILILAIIALIAIPAITKIVGEARKQSFKQTATNMVEAADKDCNVALQNGVDVVESYTISNYEITSGQKLSISGKIPMQGKFDVNDSCDVAIAVNNTKWCASKNYADDRVTLSEYVDGNCTYTSGSGGGSPTGDLLVDKIAEISAAELTTGVNLGVDEYDTAISTDGASIGYYTGKYFSGSNPNNYIIIDGSEFRIIGLTNQGIAVVGDTGSYLIDDGYGNFTIDTTFKNNFNDLGLVRKANYFTSSNSGDSNSFGDYDYDTSTYTGGTISYGDTVSSDHALLSFYDYESTIDRQAYSTCLKSSAIGTYNFETALDFVNCAQTSWLGNNIYLNIGFYFYGTGAISPGYLAAGKFNFADSAGNGDNGVCTDCVSKMKLFVRNDSYYVSGTGTQADPFMYETAFDASSFKQTDCFFLDASGSTINAFDTDNSACLRNVVIPATINDKPITTINYSAFYNSSITSVDFSNATNLEYIGDGAFANNLISSAIVLPSNIVTISDGAFADNDISGELIIPSSVISIGYNAFADNNIETLTFASGSNLTTLGWQAFSNNLGLAGTIDLPATITSMDDSMFCWTNISTINIPNGLTGLTSGALNCTNNLTTINIDQVYNGLQYSPWGNSTATINWLRAQTYDLTYDSSKVGLNSTCLSESKYIGNCTITVNSIVMGYKLVSYKVNGVLYTTNTFVMPGENTAITDIVTVESYSLESAHTYANNMNQTFTMTVPGATKIQVTFSSNTYIESSYDRIYLTNAALAQVGTSAYYTGSGLSSKVFIVDGNTINIRLTSDGSGTYYGFYADVVKYE